MSVIVHISPWPMIVGGVQRFIFCLAQHFSKSNDVHIVCPKPRNGESKHWKPLLGKVTLHEIDRSDIANVIDSISPNIIHHHHPSGGWGIKHIQEKYPFVGTQHGWLENQQTIDGVIPICGDHLNKIRHGIDLSIFTPPTERKKRDGIIVGIVGRRSYEKIPKSFLDSLEKWTAPKKLILRVVGRGIIHTEMDAITQKLSTLSFVELIDDVSPAEIADVYRDLDLLLIPSQTEAVCYSAMEAMACGTPVIARAIEGLIDTVGDAGILANTDGGLLAAVTRLAESKKDIAPLRVKAEQRAQELFDQTIMLEQYERIYERQKTKFKEEKQNAHHHFNRSRKIEAYQTPPPRGSWNKGIAEKRPEKPKTEQRPKYFRPSSKVRWGEKGKTKVEDQRTTTRAAINGFRWGNKRESIITDSPKNEQIQLSKVPANVSVIMAVYNTRPEWLQSAVESIRTQTVKPAELILVDDGSTNDKTIAEINRLASSCRILRLPQNIGAGPARNEALKVASGELIAIMDSDDIAKQKWLETMLWYLLKYPDADIISPVVEFMDGRPSPHLPSVVTFENMGKRPWVACHPGMIYRRHDALAVGGYGTTSTGSDLMLWRRMLANGAVLRNIPDKLIRYRTHDAQLTTGEIVGQNLQIVMDTPLKKQKRILVGSYFLPDPNSAGGGPNIYIDEVKYLEERDDCKIKWVYALPGEMSENNKVSEEGIELRTKWQCEQVALGNAAGLAAIIKKFKPDIIFPLGWHLALDLHSAQSILGTHIPTYTRAEHVNFISGEMSIDKAQNELTRAQHEWQISVKARELAAYQASSAVLCVSEDDTNCVKQNTVGVPVYFVPPVVHAEKRQYNPKTSSKDVVFLGGTWHRGNIDALIYLMRDVWPFVKEKSPESKVKICGVCGTGLGQWNEAKKIIDQYPDDIEVLGFVPDLGDVFEDIACSVVPVITGGGVKIKLQTSFSFRCPAITTPWVADEFKLGPEFDSMIGNDPQDYAEKILNLILFPEKRINAIELIDVFNELWSAKNRNAVIDRAIPQIRQRIISAANCITLPIADRCTHLFQARSDTLVRLLSGEINEADYSELIPYFKPRMVTPIPEMLPPEWDVFFWSNMVDETTWAIDFHGWPFGPNHAYDDALKPEMVSAFWAKYHKIDKPTLAEREANYHAINFHLVRANPNVRRILLLYDTSRFHLTKPEAAKSYDESAEHMASILSSLGWEIYRVPKGQEARKTDNHWAHYDEQWTREWLLDILEENNAVQR